MSSFLIKDIEYLFERYNTKYSFLNDILPYWNANYRFYHNSSHLFNLLDRISKDYNPHTESWDILSLAAIFHDIVYVPGSDSNEELSAYKMLKCFGMKFPDSFLNHIEELKINPFLYDRPSTCKTFIFAREIIHHSSCNISSHESMMKKRKEIDLKYPNQTDEFRDSLTEYFYELDYGIILCPFKDLLSWEDGISKEFIPFYGKHDYYLGRFKFLSNLLDSEMGQKNKENLEELRMLVSSRLNNLQTRLL